MHLSKLLSFWYCMDNHHSTLLFVPSTGLRDWPVQPSNTLLMKNSMKSRECALVWHQVWSQSLCLYHNPINSVQLVWWELTYLVRSTSPTSKALMRNSILTSYNPDTCSFHWHESKDYATKCTSLSLWILITNYTCKHLVLFPRLKRELEEVQRRKEEKQNGRVVGLCLRVGD